MAKPSGDRRIDVSVVFCCRYRNIIESLKKKFKVLVTSLEYSLAGNTELHTNTLNKKPNRY